MPELLQITAALLAGMALGAIYFAGLWWTVKKGLAAQYPAVWFGASFLVRNAFVLAGFYWLAGAEWQRLLVCLAGFIIARFLVAGRIKARGECHAS